MSVNSTTLLNLLRRLIPLPQQSKPLRREFPPNEILYGWSVGVWFDEDVSVVGAGEDVVGVFFRGGFQEGVSWSGERKTGGRRGEGGRTLKTERES